MRAEIISIGTELLLGEITDTNASYLAGQLPLLGIDLYWISQVGDNQARLVEVLKRAWQRSELILTTGGLGPTEDDLTREAIAEFLGEKLEAEPALEREIRGLFAQRGIEMPLSNLKQATIIPSAEPIRNARGTAPGWWVEKDGCLLIAMPGPPMELQEMWQKKVEPRLRQSSVSIIVSKTLKTLGLSEAAVGELVFPLFSSANPTLGVYAKADGIHLRFTAKAENRKQAEKLIAKHEASIRAILGAHIWGTDEDTLEGIIGRLLMEKGLNLAVMESCTGGLLMSTIADVSGSSKYFKGGLVACSNEAKITYGIDAQIIAECGAVSPEVAQAMAEAAKKHLGADVGISIAGVTEETEAKSAGVVYIGIDDGKRCRVIKGNYPGSKTQVTRRAISVALFELMKTLTGE